MSLRAPRPAAQGGRNTTEEEENGGAGGIAGERLRSLIERIERLEEERATIAADIREVYAEGKAAGFDVRIMRRVVRLRKMEKTERDEQETPLELYLRAIGMDDGPGTAE